MDEAERQEFGQRLLEMGKRLREQDSGLTDACEAILGVGHGRWTVRSLAEHLELDRTLVALALLRLEEEGRIKGDWLNIWPDSSAT